MKSKPSRLNRRQFLATSAAGSSLAAAPAFAAEPTKAAVKYILKEHGFWDYTTPGAGGMATYQLDDYLSLLDDMAKAGMNSLCVYVKWLTTGYRSRLPFLDQTPGSPVMDSNNRLLQQAMEEARKRHIKIWLGAVTTYFDAARLPQSKPWHIYDKLGGYQLPFRVGNYTADTPGLIDWTVQIFEEMLEQFPGADGLVVELEGAGMEMPERIPLYNRWARENNRPPFEQLGHPLNPRRFDVPAWRDYTTFARLKILKAVEDAVRAKGFRGDLSMICETENRPYSAVQEVNLQMYRERFPKWKAVTYEYEKYQHRYSMMDLCIDTPKKEGLEVYYLPRGIMTWGSTWPIAISLEESWRRDIEDINQFQPHAVWWFGSGTTGEGIHASLPRLRQSGYQDGVDARRALLKAVFPLKTKS